MSEPILPYPDFPGRRSHPGPLHEGEGDVADAIAAALPDVEDNALHIDFSTPEPGQMHRQELTRPVIFADRIPRRQRRREDMFDAVGCMIGIALVLLMGVYAHSTTQGVTADITTAFSGILSQVLLFPVSLIESLFVLVAPLSIIISMIRRGRFTGIIQTLLATFAAAAVGVGTILLLSYAPDAISEPLSVTTATGRGVAINLLIVTLATLFTTAGEMSDMRTVKYSWWGLWVIVILGILRGSMTLPGAIISVLLGRTIGCLARWFLGFEDRRATPRDLVQGLLDVDIAPSRIIRTDLDTDTSPLATWTVRPATAEDAGRGLVMESADTDATSYTVTQHVSHFEDRRYRVWDDNGNDYDLMILDPGRELTGTIQDIWNNLRLKGITRWIAPSLNATAERATLASLTAFRAGVATPEPVGIAPAGDSVAVISRTMPPSARLRDIPAEQLADETLDAAWRELARAHSVSLAHRNIGADSVVLDTSGTVWLLDWNQGEVAASELNQRIDNAQMLVLLSLCAGPERAIDSARRVVGDAELRAMAPVLQKAVLSPSISADLRRSDLLSQLRGALVEDAPVEATQPLKLQRFAPRTVVMAVVLVAALVAVFTSINLNQVITAITSANPLWILIAFALAALTWVGGGIPVVAFSPKKIALKDAVLAQVAASIVTLVTPAGIGPAALNLRFLTKQKLTMPLAVATVTLQQISQFLTTVVLLLLIVVFTGQSVSIPLPYTTIIAVAAGLLVVIAVIVAVPKFRAWVWAKVEPTWKQIYPQVMWLIGQPRRLLWALGGNMLMNVGFVGAFWASLEAFGGGLDFMTLTITYLVANTAGSVIPSPGGIGPVELALTTGLTVAGISPAIALSAAVVYRVVTFYGRAPFGWFGMRNMERRGLL